MLSEFSWIKQQSIEIVIKTLPCPVKNPRELDGLIRADETVNLTAGRKVIERSVEPNNLGLSGIGMKVIVES